MNLEKNPISQPFHSGFVGVLGRPNVGKSTLVNTIIGDKVSIVSHKPQTTRCRILGILTRSDAQICFIDAPGIHRPQENLHKIMVKTAMGSLDESDCIVLMVPPSKPGESEALIIDLIKRVSKPVILAINKVDQVQKEIILPLIDAYSKYYEFAHIVPISALRKTNIDSLLSAIISLLPEESPLFPEDMKTDRSEIFQIAELIREKVFIHTHKEIPYSAGVIIEEMKLNPKNSVTSIHAIILVERTSHKGIIIGKQGTKLRTIGQQARLEIEKLIQTKVFLDLRVKCVPDWKKTPHLLSKMGLL
ncbi:MAG: GTPase Era [Candidatus Schekmanbacteria bacterium RBG_13_48_7]|uniref:GTPase Era n=1 Tax=Candidatus Schekmanbacteria bacterium RBG_13_48_7 TaxID=1817878 RepID=A0A1F7RWV4_9BACT|nr:MAG: GTPase Era [Candidatus Schekmanbacteria bacterium RBG_13_48_7]